MLELLPKDDVLANRMFSSLGCVYAGMTPCGKGLSGGGFDGMLVFTSSAWKNFGALSGLAMLDAEFRSIRIGLDDIDELGPSLITLPVIDLLPLLAICRPSPLVACASSAGISCFPTEETGLDILAVPLGAPLDVGEAVSALAFLDPDLGVIFELKKGLTGVGPPSSTELRSAPRASTAPSARRVGKLLIAGDPASFGRGLTLPAHFGDCVLLLCTGRRLGTPFCLSWLIVAFAAPCRVFAGG